MKVYLDDGFGEEVEVPIWYQKGADFIKVDNVSYQRTGFTWAGLRVYRRAG